MRYVNLPHGGRWPMREVMRMYKEQRAEERRQQQLSLFEPAAEPPQVLWAKGGVDRSGIAAYVHLIRAKGDPERAPRQAGGGDRAPHRTLAKRPNAELAEIIVGGLQVA